jgi:hypothetical protein
LLIRELVRQTVADNTGRMQDANNAPRCMQVKVNGVRCGSPAMRGKPFCYFHHRFHNRPIEDGFPPLEDGSAIQWSLMQVLHGVLKGRIDLKQASVLIYGLQTASANLKQSDFWKSRDSVLEDPVDQMQKLRAKAAGTASDERKEEATAS